jgi:putative ABC transport system ATP-binding protein
MTVVVELSEVSRTYRSRAEDVPAVVAASLELHAGVVTALVGPSGSGKSTLINLIVGWELPDEGVVRTHSDVRDNWDSVAVVPQGLGLLAELTMAENIRLPAVLGNRAALDFEELCESLGLGHLGDQLPEAVSLGEQQRAAVARALLPQPTLLIADEPTAHQDEANTLLVAELMRSAAGSGSSVLIATHDPRVLAVADVVIEILDGRLTVRDPVAG